MPNVLFWSLFAVVCLVGLCVGSFLNVVICRLPAGESLSRPPSHCPRCGEKIRWYDNIPLLSYVILRGKCRHCGEKISPRYPAVEALNLLLWAACWLLWFPQRPAYAILFLPVISVLLATAFIDADTGMIPDRFHVVLAAVLVAACLFDGSAILLSRAVGGLGTGIFLLGVSLVFRAVSGRDGMGFGDVKLMTVCGGLLGFGKAFLALLVASVAASIVLTARAAREGAREFPFAPYLAAGLIFSILFGEPLIELWLGLFV